MDNERARRLESLVWAVKEYLPRLDVLPQRDGVFEGEWMRVAEEVLAMPREPLPIAISELSIDPRTCEECRVIGRDERCGAIFNYKHKICLEYHQDRERQVERRAAILVAAWASNGKIERPDLLAWAASLMDRLFRGRGLNQEDVAAWRRVYERGQGSATAAAKVAPNAGPAIYCQSEEDPL